MQVDIRIQRYKGKEYRYEYSKSTYTDPDLDLKKELRRIECICCGDLFQSKSKFNRMCRFCKDSDGNYAENKHKANKVLK